MLVSDRMAELGLTQRDLGVRSGLSKSAITRILQGERNPQTQTLEHLAAALELPLVALVDPPLRPDAPDTAEARPAGARAALLTSGSRPSGATPVGGTVPSDERGQGSLSVWYPVYLWGMRVDPRRPEAAPRGTYVERPVPVGDETERIGADGFGLVLNDTSLSNWEGTEGQSLHRGWIVWCNPDARDGVQDGDLVVADDPARGLFAAVYRQSDDGLFLETDDAGFQDQERRRTEPGHVVGPVVMATLFGGVPRRRQRRGAAGEAAGTARAPAGTG